ncbi:MAG TPA: hypothetical protein VIK08_07220 [Candidatus Limnocylindrales bacterium]
MSERARFVVALAAGIPLALLGLVFGLLAMGSMVLVAVLIGFMFGRIAFAGFTISLGGTWAILFFLAARDCAQPSQPCGATPIDLAPHIVISVALVATGAVAAVLSRRARRAAADP